METITIDRKILYEYVDACELVRETEEDLRTLERRAEGIIHDAVRGSNPEFPYEPRTFRIEGLDSRSADTDVKRYRSLLKARISTAQQKKLAVDAWMNTIPSRMQRIVRMKYFQGMTWNEVAVRLGGCQSGDGVRKEFIRFMAADV